MERSLLSKFLVLLRRTRGYSAEYVAEKLNTRVVRYIVLEQEPEKVPTYELHALLDFFELNEEEYLQLALIIFEMSKAKKTMPDLKKTEIVSKNIADLFASRELNLKEILRKKGAEEC